MSTKSKSSVNVLGYRSFESEFLVSGDFEFESFLVFEVLSLSLFCVFFDQVFLGVQVVSLRIFIATVMVLGVLVGRLACSGSLACSVEVCSV